MQDNKKQNLKRIGILVVIISLIVVIIVGISQYKSYQYLKELKQAKEQYNEKQKECVPIGTTNNYIYVTRTDEERKAIQGSVWKVTTYNGKEKGTFETNENGNGGIVGLDYGEYYLEEISVPENYTKKDYRYKVILSAYDTSYTLTETNAKNDGKLLIVLTNEEKQPIEGKKYNVSNSKNEFVSTITTNEKGLAGLKNLPDGTYYVQESDNKKAKKYSVYIQNYSLERLDITGSKEN